MDDLVIIVEDRFASALGSVRYSEQQYQYTQQYMPGQKHVGCHFRYEIEVEDFISKKALA